MDGNGRVGRLLITLMFCHDNVLRKPLLYPSSYFKQHRQQYYDELNSVRATGDYERWIDFFAETIRHGAEVAIETGRRVTQALREDRTLLRIEQLNIGHIGAGGGGIHCVTQQEPL